MNEITEKKQLQCLLVSATEKEMSALKNQFPNIDSCTTGIGIAHTIYGLTKKLQTTKYDLVIEIGIAGTLDKDIALCETVLVQEEIFGDMGVVENGVFIPVFNPMFMAKNPFHYDEQGFLKNANALLEKFDFKKVRASTVNEITTSPERIIYLQNQGIQIESMEGAGVHLVCLNEKIPFLQIRTISNVVGVRDKSQWRIKEAIEQLTIDTACVLTTIL